MSRKIITVSTDLLYSVYESNINMMLTCNPVVASIQLQDHIPTLLNYAAGDHHIDELKGTVIYESFANARVPTDVIEMIMYNTIKAICNFLDTHLMSRFSSQVYHYFFSDDGTQLLIIRKPKKNPTPIIAECLLAQLQQHKRTSDTKLDLLKFVDICVGVFNEDGHITL